MSLRKIEAIADAISNLTSYSDPESEAYKLRNPGLLQPRLVSHILGKPQQVVDGKRVFTCHIAGYKALLDFIQKRCERFPKDELRQLLLSYTPDGWIPKSTIEFLQSSLADHSISDTTPLSYFNSQDKK